MQIYAMAGLAEAGMIQVVGLQFLGNVFLIVLAIVVVASRSRTVATLAALLWLLECLLLAPWVGFFDRPNDDPDWNGFLPTFRAIAQWWAGLSLVLLFAVLAVWLKPSLRSWTEEWRADDSY
jgi:hypothetical protein